MRPQSSSHSTNGFSRKKGAEIFASVRYAECLKNHAAGIGGYAVDGCREFVPSGVGGSSASATAALLCAACGCHRSFHRRELDDCSSSSNTASSSPDR